MPAAFYFYKERIMTEDLHQPTADQGEEASFAELFAAQEEQSVSRLSSGQRVKATVVAITADTVFVSTGSKVDGIVDRAELAQDGVAECAVGDVLDLYVVHVSAQEVRLSKVVRGAGGVSALEEAKEAGLPVEGKVSAQVKGGFAVEVMKRRAFCPISQMDVRPVDAPESLVGKTFSFMITKLEKGGRNIVVSRRVLLEKQQSAGREEFLGTVKEGDVLEATVVRLAPFGAFVELAPGVDGMVHVSELSWARGQAPEEVVSVGDKVRVKILSLKTQEKGSRISLSMRQVTENPWTNLSGINAGDIVSGKVTRLAAFGAFVEVLPGIEGLIHLSELSWERRINKAEEVLSVGETVSVKVKEVDLDKKRLSLSLRDAAGDPWADVAERFPVGAEVSGVFEKRAPFGLFIQLSPGVTGLMPKGAAAQAKPKGSLDRLAPGAAVQVVIREADLQNRRLTLAPVGAEAESGDAPVKDSDWKRHAPKPEPASNFSSLGSAFQAALAKKSGK